MLRSKNAIILLIGSKEIISRELATVDWPQADLIARQSIAATAVATKMPASFCVDRNISILPSGLQTWSIVVMPQDQIGRPPLPWTGRIAALQPPRHSVISLSKDMMEEGAIAPYGRFRPIGRLYTTLRTGLNPFRVSNIILKIVDFLFIDRWLIGAR